MLKSVPQNLSPELLKLLMEMGHGDEIVIADGNFPSASHARNLVRCDGLNVPEILNSILTLLPLDHFVDAAVGLMSVAEGDNYQPTIWETYKSILKEKKVENEKIEYLERFEFYERSKTAYAIVATSESALYANIILKKGVVQ